VRGPPWRCELSGGGLAAGGGAPSRGQGEAVGVGGEGCALVWCRGSAAGRPPTAAWRLAHPPWIGLSRAGEVEGEREARGGGEGEG
jgi:hypothetical protein